MTVNPLRQKRWLISAVAIVSALVLAIVVWITVGRSTDDAIPQSPTGPTGGAAVTPDCPGSPARGINRTLTNGAAWTMCWSIDPYQGLVLSDISYTAPGQQPIRLIHDLALGQLEVPYDSGERTTDDITSQGFGGRNLQTISKAECTGDIRRTYVPNYGEGKVGGGENRDVLCVEIEKTGLAFRANRGGQVVTAQGDALVISTISKVGWYEYLNQYRFDGSGRIEPALGATGTLSPEDYTSDHHHGNPVGHGDHDRAVSHSHNAVWRVHWDLQGRGKLRAQEYNAAFTGKKGPESLEIDGTLTDLPTETTRDHDDRRWWRVVNPAVRNADDHPISYEIDLQATDAYGAHAHPGADPEERPDPDYAVAFTQHDSCQRFASKNRDAGCGDGVSDYVADHQRLGDIVSWVAVGFHHVVRDEDQSPMDVHWQGFTMSPRDLLAQRPAPPSGYASANGRPSATP